MNGSLTNFLAIVIGSGIGLFIKRGIPERYKETIMQSLGIAVGIIGLKMALSSENMILVILSIAIGAVCGECLKIQQALDHFGAALTHRLGDRYGDVGRGFVTATLVFCIGAMAIVGSIQEGINGDSSILYAKSMLDGIIAIVFAAAMGIGIALAAIPVLFYQGMITICASVSGEAISQSAITELTAVGGILIIGISLNMLELKLIRVANLLPSIPIVILFVMMDLI